MDPYRKTGVTVGVLFISATVASILGSVFIGSILEAPNYLTGISAHGSGLIIGVLFFFNCCYFSVCYFLYVIPHS